MAPFVRLWVARAEPRTCEDLRLAKVVARPVDLPVDHPATHLDDYPSTWLQTRLAMERSIFRSTPDGRRLDLPLDFVKLALRLRLKRCGLWQRGITNGLDIC